MNTPDPLSEKLVKYLALSTYLVTYVALTRVYNKIMQLYKKYILT